MKAGVRWSLTALLLVGAWLFFWLWHPEWMSFQEQNQLFLWTTDYLLQRISVAGGLADWLGEFVVQFFYVEWLGALLMALLLVLMQRASLMALTLHPSLFPYNSSLITLVFPLFFLWLLGDENVLVALPVAVVLVLAAVALMRRTRWYWWLAIVPALWWAVGGPWTTYYRTPQQGPELAGWNKDKWELLKQDYLIRHERWDDVVERAKEHVVQTSFWSNSVNLALAMTGQLADRQFDFWQSGEDALLMPMVRDNISNLPTMEAFWHLGMVNSALRYASDLQESILNARKSGRLEQRIVECLLVNGNDTIAHKHMQLLKKSLFYRSWAKSLECRLDSGELSEKRQLRYKENFLYSYPEIDKMLGLLFRNNTQNKMALEYFLGQLLLKGDAQTFMQALPWAQQYGGYSVMPMTYQDAVSCMRSRQVPDTPYGRYVKRMMGGQQR
mgnify:CR=1 FL=1